MTYENMEIQCFKGVCDGALWAGGPWNPESFGEVGKPLFQLPMHLLCLSHPVSIRGTG